MTIADGFLILVTFLGPVAAVQAQKWVERARETRNRKIAIFHTLMSTRALRAASPEHVQALNSLDLTFDSRKKNEKPILDAWSEYLDHLNHYPNGAPPREIQDWNGKGEDILAKLLQKIADCLGYDFNTVLLKRGIYYPRGHSDLITAQIALRDMVVKLSSGTWALPMAVREFPLSSEAVKLQMDVQRAILEALSGKGPLRVVIEPTSEAGHPASTKD